MSLKIIDASVGIKWFVKEEREGSAAIQILREVEKDPKFFAVPELFFIEMLSVFCRLSSSEKEIGGHLRDLQDLGLERIGNGAELLSAAVQLAVRHRISGYDAIYAACAQLTSGVWITADKKAHEKIRSLKISQCLRPD